MLKFLMVLVGGIFFVFISVCSYKFIRHGKDESVSIKFMTSLMILFSFTIVLYGDIFFNQNETNGGHGEFAAKHESKVFTSNYHKSLEEDKEKLDSVNKEKLEIKITAYFDNASPSRGSITNLIITGPPKGKVTAICQYKGHGTPYIRDIGANGQVVIPIKVENDAEPGFLVVVDIAVSYGGMVYNANSVFTPT